MGYLGSDRADEEVVGEVSRSDLVGFVSDLLVAILPVSWTATVVGNRENTDLLIHRVVNQGVWKTSHHKTASTVSPYGAQRRVFKKQADGVFELGNKR